MIKHTLIMKHTSIIIKLACTYKTYTYENTNHIYIHTCDKVYTYDKAYIYNKAYTYVKHTSMIKSTHL